MLDWLLDPLSYDFMKLALLEVTIVGIVAGFLGTFVVMRGMAFMGDAISHAVFPGVVIAFLAKTSLFLGGAAFGIFTALAISSLSLTRRIKEDTAIGVVFAGAFALGVVLISTSDNYTGDLTAFLFGDVLAVTHTDIYLSVVFGGISFILAFLLRRVLILVSFDREMALSMGVPVFWLETLLLLLVTLTIVISLRAVGNVLVLAMFVTPAATARLLADDAGKMMLISSVLGALSGICGLYISWYTDLAAGGTIVLTATVVFLVVMVSAPRHGLIAHALRGRSNALPEPAASEA
jgi:manganese/iron transport system permease protein